ncbi:hypothetical protein [Dyadobacter sp. CY312]|uniref:hypothetical protein n=1 Tax=Dyadobacter sp. CY312 TaxID=2907303 RepID=UPI001F3162A3|nr:hypothetical protein [Dyadobacter sp. CY312]MCE7044129.1 hypothetical protein [Dyadobacter sp. CY312]
MIQPNKKYSISAVYSPIQRIRTIVRIGQNEHDCTEKMRSEGFTDPFKVTELIDDPSERQMSYATDLGLTIPARASMQDVAAMIDFKKDNDSNPDSGLLEFAYQERLYVSKYIGEKALYDFIFESVDLPIKIAFFIFSVHRNHHKGENYNLNEHPHKDHFMDFATQKIHDVQFKKSMNRYSGNELQYFGESNQADYEYVHRGSKATIAYKAAYDFLKSKELVKLPSEQASKYQKKSNYFSLGKNYPIYQEKYSGYQYKNEENSGVKGCIISLVAIFFLIYLLFSC